MEKGRRHEMSCPYLTQVTMSFCAAYPVKKLVPTARVVTESACDGEAFSSCPVFREVLARRSNAAPQLQQASHEAESKGGGS
jgi:hypothetical protein